MTLADVGVGGEVGKLDCVNETGRVEVAEVRRGMRGSAMPALLACRENE